jgi:hypothetical protein
MTNPITIPPEALKAAAEAICRERCAFMGEPPCFEIGEGLSPQCDEPGCSVEARAACLAMLRNWPRMEIERFAPWSKDRTIHLPLPKETDNAEG